MPFADAHPMAFWLLFLAGVAFVFVGLDLFMGWAGRMLARRAEEARLRGLRAGR